MKKGNEMGLTPIKCENKEGCDALKQIHVNINDLLYYWTYKYMSPIDAKLSFKQLCKYGQQLTVLEVPERAQAKKLELINAIRPIAVALRDYAENYHLSISDAPQATATAKYTLSLYLKDKEAQQLSDNNIIYHLKEAQRVRENMLKPLNLPTAQLDNLTKELIDFLYKRYK